MQRILLVVAILVLLAFAVGRAQAPTTPVPPVYAAPRFQIVELHPSAASEWSGLLDTQTGCTWVYADTPGTEKEYVWDFIAVDANSTSAPTMVAKQQLACDTKLWLPAAVASSPPSGESL
jgi:hypothetical protein